MNGQCTGAWTTAALLATTMTLIGTVSRAQEEAPAPRVQVRVCQPAQKSIRETLDFLGRAEPRRRSRSGPASAACWKRSMLCLGIP